MGGRGASSGISVKGKKYGSEYRTLYQSGNIKFLKYNDSNNSKTPMETMTKGRVYAIINSNNEIKSITTYDEDGKRNKQIDVFGKPHKIDGKYELPHTHLGYLHDENGTYKPSASDKNLIDTVFKEWYNFIKKEAVR